MDKNVKVGDKIEVTGADMTAGRYSNGDVLTVSEVIDTPIIPHVYVEEHDVLLFPREFEVLPSKPEEGKTWDGVTIKVGDKIKIVKEWLSGGKYNEGDVLTVNSLEFSPRGTVHGVNAGPRDAFVSYSAGEFEVIGSAVEPGDIIIEDYHEAIGSDKTPAIHEVTRVGADGKAWFFDFEAMRYLHLSEGSYKLVTKAKDRLDK